MASSTTDWKRTAEHAPAAARHPDVLRLFKNWSDRHENQRAFVLRSEICLYLGELQTFVEEAERTLASVRAQALGAVRFKDSIAAAEALLRHAKDKREFFERRFAQIGYESKTFARKMTFDEQKMVPQARDLGDIADKIRQFKLEDAAMPELTPSQAWALVAAHTHGELNAEANWELAINRLQELNQQWGTMYGLADLKTTLNYMTSGIRIATQYRMEQAPGAQQAMRNEGTPLYKLMMQSGFKNTWETGSSQASSDRGVRGAVEEQMGYSSALRRTAGKPHEFDSAGKFDVKTAAEMPRYASPIAAAQEPGVALRYGTSYVVWKDSVRKRATWTPGDSWNRTPKNESDHNLKNFVGLDHPECIFAHADKDLLRVFLAEATGKEQEWLATFRSREFAAGGAYIEIQIHGALTWADVAQVVIDSALPQAAQIVNDFEHFKIAKKYDFPVRLTNIAPVAPPRSAQ